MFCAYADTCANPKHNNNNNNNNNNKNPGNHVASLQLIGLSTPKGGTNTRRTAGTETRV